MPYNSQLKSEWRSLQTASRFGSDDLSAVEHHVEVRQLLNCEHCLRKAHADGDIDWLLHIDSDELFFIDDLDAAAHFGRLSSHKCVSFRYPIHEGCPEQVDSSNVFESVTLFRRHIATLEKTISTRAATSTWPRRHWTFGDTMAEGTTWAPRKENRRAVSFLALFHSLSTRLRRPSRGS